jgi:hypothetical protein
VSRAPNFLQVQTDAVVALLGILDSAGPSLAQWREEDEAAEAEEKAAEGASKEETE